MAKGHVVAKLVGGLGNQLFGYTAARRIALSNSAPLALDLTFFGTDTEFGRTFELSCFNLADDRRIEASGKVGGAWGKLARHAETLAARSGLLFQNDYLVESTSGEFRPVHDRRVGSKNLVMIGYWQDERYFLDVEDQIRTDLTMNLAPNLDHQRAAEGISSANAVAVHVRGHKKRYDDAAKARVTLSKEYYARAFSMVRSHVRDPHFFCFSDRPESLHEIVPMSSDVSIVKGAQGDEATLVDFWLMRQCKHFIIANSSYSWWAAWLGGHREKVVVAPTKDSIRYAVTPARNWIATTDAA
jgi:hypothetical protein